MYSPTTSCPQTNQHISARFRRPAAGIAVVGAMSFGIATALIAIGVLSVQAGRLADRLFGGHGILAHAPRISAIIITLLGLGLLARAMLDH